jgi:hypothetical protein
MGSVTVLNHTPTNPVVDPGGCGSEIAHFPFTLAAGVAAAQPWRRQRRTAEAGQCALALITRTRDPFERLISACEQISSSMSATSISVVGSHCKVLGISPGQMRQNRL